MDWVCFLGLNPNSDYAGQEDNGNCYAPGEIMHRLTKNPAYSASRMYAPRVMPHRYTPRHYNYLSRTACPCGEAMHARPRRRQAKSCGGGLAGCRFNIDDTAVCFVDHCSMLTRVLRVLFFFFCRRDRSAKKLFVVLWALGRHTHIAQHAPRTTMHIAPRWRLLTTFS